ncbi:MAG TPA: hypothetical protein VG274_01725, partial [Rhizomicrobium sp.]|nr:hypothetical protein [Rhizomicrobium sp.]
MSRLPSIHENQRDHIAVEPAQTSSEHLVMSKDAANAARLLREGVVWSILGALITLGLALFFGELPRVFVSMYIFTTLEPAAVGVELVALLSACMLLRARASTRWDLILTLPALGPRAIIILSTGTAVFAAIGHFVVYHDQAQSVDEFMTRFGAAMLSHGDLLAHIPTQWKPFGLALQPLFTFFSPDGDLWGSPYRPVNAALHAIFGFVPGGERFTNPVLAGLSVFLVARIAAQLWPERKDAPFVAALLMAVSAQVLVNGMTYYAMPAHLAFNLAWLLFFLRGRLVGHAIAALIGVFAVGLHQVNFHPLFVIPFLTPVLLSRRWPLALFYGAVYAAALVFWVDWYQIALWWSGVGFTQAADSGGDNFVHRIWEFSRLPGFAAWLFMSTNFARFFSWQSVLLAPLAIIGLRSWREAPPIVRQGVWGLLIGSLPFMFVTPEQGGGWGYRYAHGLIGNIILLSVFGWIQLVPRERM